MRGVTWRWWQYSANMLRTWLPWLGTNSGWSLRLWGNWSRRWPKLAGRPNNPIPLCPNSWQWVAVWPLSNSGRSLITISKAWTANSANSFSGGSSRHWMRVLAASAGANKRWAINLGITSTMPTCRIATRSGPLPDKVSVNSLPNANISSQ